MGCQQNESTGSQTSVVFCSSNPTLDQRGSLPRSKLLHKDRVESYVVGGIKQDGQTSQDLNCRIDAKRQDDWWFNDVAEEVSGGESSVSEQEKSIIRLGPHFYL